MRGLIDGHMHMMAFEFLGGRIHCGRPWHPYGVAAAMVDCPDHKARGIRTGMKAKRVKGRSKAFGRGVRRSGRFVYRVRGGRVRSVAVTTLKTRKSVRRNLKLARL